MGLRLSEGEILLLPCKTCSTLCVRFSVSAGSSKLVCPRCARLIDVLCERRQDGWAIRVTADGELLAMWE